MPPRPHAKESFVRQLEAEFGAGDLFPRGTSQPIFQKTNFTLTNNKNASQTEIEIETQGASGGTIHEAS